MNVVTKSSLSGESILELTSLAKKVWCDDKYLWVLLTDGRQLAVPLSFYPRLFHATPAQRRRYELIGEGIGITWEELDEDISVAGLLLGRRDETVLGRGLITIEEARRRSAIAQKRDYTPRRSGNSKKRVKARRSR